MRKWECGMRKNEVTGMVLGYRAEGIEHGAWSEGHGVKNR